MTDTLWGLELMLVGMGTVFGLLLLLMVGLMIIGKVDVPRSRAEIEPSRPEPAVPPGTGVSAVITTDDGLDGDTIAAIVVAVATHAEIRRQLAAPETRSDLLGRQLFASRWLAIGRSQQHQPFGRR